jgi:transposase, IS30 family
MGERCRAWDFARVRSPGRLPSGRREHRVRFWAAVARGLSSREAGVQAGVSPAVGVRWFRKGGGMPTVTQAPLSGRYLSFVEREEIAILRAGGVGCGGSLVSSGVRRRRSLVSCVATW